MRDKEATLLSLNMRVALVTTRLVEEQVLHPSLETKLPRIRPISYTTGHIMNISLNQAAAIKELNQDNKMRTA